MYTRNQKPRDQRHVLPCLAVVVLLAVAGCSLPRAPDAPPGSAATAPASPPPVTPTASSPAVASPVASTASTPSPQPTPVLEQPVAIREGSIAEHPVTASLYAVQRTGSMATVNMRLKANKATDKFIILWSLNDGNPKVLARSGSAPDGIRMIDGAHHKAYLAATTPDGTCLCQPQPDQSVMWAEKTHEVWVSVTFAAPPADVTTVDVVVPLFGTFSHVPIR